MNKEYKTFEELKEELGDKFEKYMYGANVNLLNNWNELKKWLEEYVENTKVQYQGSHPIRQYSLEIIKDVLQVTIDKMQELEGKSE